MKFESLLQMTSMESGVWRRFGVHVFEGKVTVEDMVRFEEAGDVWNTRNPGRLVEMVVIFPSDAGMTSEERTRMAQVIKRFEKNRAASATVILASGLLGSLHRSVLTGLLMLVPPPHPSKVFGGTAAAVAWLAPHIQTLCGSDATMDEIVLGVDEFCTRFKARRGTTLSASS